MFGGVRSDLHLAGLEQPLDFVLPALPSKEQGERAAEGASGSGEDLVTDGNGLAKRGLGFGQAPKPELGVPEISKVDRLRTPVSDFSMKVEGLHVAGEGLCVLPLGMKGKSKISKDEALGGAVSDFSFNLKSL